MYCHTYTESRTDEVRVQTMQDSTFRGRRSRRSPTRPIVAQLPQEDAQGRVRRRRGGPLPESFHRPAPAVDGRRLRRSGGEAALPEVPYEGGALFVDWRAVLVRDMGHARDYGPVIQGGRDETDIARCYGDDRVILRCRSLQYRGWFDELGYGEPMSKHLKASDSDGHAVLQRK